MPTNKGSTKEKETVTLRITDYNGNPRNVTVNADALTSTRYGAKYSNLSLEEKLDFDEFTNREHLGDLAFVSSEEEDVDLSNADNPENMIAQILGTPDEQRINGALLDFKYGFMGRYDDKTFELFHDKSDDQDISKVLKDDKIKLRGNTKNAKFIDHNVITKTLVDSTLSSAKRFNIDPYRLLASGLVEASGNKIIHENTYFNTHDYVDSQIPNKDNIRNLRKRDDLLKALGVYQKDGKYNPKTIERKVKEKDDYYAELFNSIYIPTTAIDAHAAFISKSGFEGVNSKQQELEGVKTTYVKQNEEAAESLKTIYPDLFTDTNKYINVKRNGGMINIKDSKKGTFTAAAKRRGMSVQEFASQVLANKDAYSKSMERKAQFAHNAKSFNHRLGGIISRQYASGGEVAFRDRYGDVQGHSYGAEKGIQGATASKGMSIGSVVGTAGGVAAGMALGGSMGSILPGIGTAIGAVIGLIGGLFAGRKKKRKAKREAEEADRQRQIVAGNNRILEDDLKLSETAPDDGPINLYGDSTNNGGVVQEGGMDANSTQMQDTTPVGMQPSGVVGQSTINSTEDVSKYFIGAKRYGGKAKRRYAAGGQIEQTSSNTAIVDGPSHEDGGVQYTSDAEVEGGEAIMTDQDSAYVFSDTLKYKGKTFADIAKPIMKHKGYLEDTLGAESLLLGRALELTDRSIYSIDRNTNGRNAEKSSAHIAKTQEELGKISAALTDLYNMQEQMKAEQGMGAEPKTEYAEGGEIDITDTATAGLQRTVVNQASQPIFTSNDRTYINPPRMIDGAMRCGGKTKKAMGGMIAQAGVNLIGGISNIIGNRAAIKRMEAMQVPQQSEIDRMNVEWDINTDSEINDVNQTVRSAEKMIRDNTSNSQIARQGVLFARTQGSRMRGKIKQDEFNKELVLRNQGRQSNKQIEMMNSQIRENNAAAKFNHEMEIIGAKSQNNAALSSVLSQTVSSIGSIYQSKFDIENIQDANFLGVLKDDKSRDYVLKNMTPAQKKRLFGVNEFKKFGGKVITPRKRKRVTA